MDFPRFISGFPRIILERLEEVGGIPWKGVEVGVDSQTFCDFPELSWIFRENLLRIVLKCVLFL